MAVATTFFAQFLRARADPAKADRSFLFLAMAAGSALAAWTGIKLKPKKKKDRACHRNK